VAAASGSYSARSLRAFASWKSAVKHLSGWGDPGSAERDVLLRRAHVVELKLSIRGTAITIPREAVLDLVDLRPDFEVGPVVEIRPAVYVYFRGGDAGESYNLHFTVQGGRLTRRCLARGVSRVWRDDRQVRLIAAPRGVE